MAAAAAPHLTFVKDSTDWVKIRSHKTKDTVCFPLSRFCLANAPKESGRCIGRIHFSLHGADANSRDADEMPSIRVDGEEDAILRELARALIERGTLGVVPIGTNDVIFAVAVASHVVSYNVTRTDEDGWRAVLQACTGGYVACEGEGATDDATRDRLLADLDYLCDGFVEGAPKRARDGAGGKKRAKPEQ